MSSGPQTARAMTRLADRMRLKICQGKTTVQCRRCVAKLSRFGPPRWATLYAAYATGNLFRDVVQNHGRQMARADGA